MSPLSSSAILTSAAGMLVLLLLVTSAPTWAQTSSEPGPLIEGHWSTSQYKTTTKAVTGFLVPLGAMNKVNGIWRPKAFEPVDGRIERTTWSVTGAPVLEVFGEVADALAEGAELLWSCSGRSCGNAAEWASRVYQERLLYGRDEFMRYAVYQTPDGVWFSLFSAARTADRQYLHLDRITPEPD